MKQSLLFCVASALAFTVFAQELQLQPEIAAVDALKPHLVYASKQLRKVAYDVEITGSAKGRGETTGEHQRLDSGFLTSATHTVLEEGKGGGSTLLVTACGLITVSMQRQMVAKGPAPVISLAGAFVGLGMKISTDVNWSARLISIKMEQGKPCQPTPGELIKFITETEHTIKVAGRPMSGVRKETTTCSAANSSSPVSNLLSAASGDYLAVTCETTTAQGSKVVKSYAFLGEANQYLLLRELDERTDASYRPKLMDFAH